MKYERPVGRSCLGRGVALGLLLALALTSACDDDPASPQECGQSLPLVTLSDPDSVLLQIKSGIVSGSITNYMSAFAQDFTFAADSLDATLFPGAFDDWSYAVEQEVMGRILADCVSRSLAFADVESTAVSAGEVILREVYTLYLGPDRYHGEADLFLSKDQQGNWQLNQWSDHRPVAQLVATWGFLRGRERVPDVQASRKPSAE